MTRTVQIALPPMEVKGVDSAVPTTANAVDTERRWLRLVPAALGKIGLNHDGARRTMDVDAGVFSAQLNAAPNRHLSFRKMVHLGPEFWAEMIDLILDFHGLTPRGLSAQDAEDMKLGRMFRQMVQRSASR